MGVNSKSVLFYSSVNNKGLFYIQRFYQIDISILEELGYSVLLSNKICEAFKFWKYDFVYAYFYRYALIVAFVAKIFGKETYFTGGIDDLDKHQATAKEYQIQKWLFKLCYWISKSCIIVSKTDDSNAREIVDGKKLAYSEHTVDIKSFACDISQKENIFVTIGWQANVGNVKRKGIDTAIRLFSRLKNVKDFSGSMLYILGKKGEGSIYLEKIVSELGVESAVVFTDQISEEEKIGFLKRSKYYFQLSIYEGFGVAALEALCAQNIVIHSGKGGLSNPIYKDGILVDIDQPEDELFNDLLSKIRRFDSSRLQNAFYNVSKNYDNKRRKEDLDRIIKK